MQFENSFEAEEFNHNFKSKTECLSSFGFVFKQVICFESFGNNF